jgi:ParB-like chromosome segregation protein Spo0J
MKLVGKVVSTRFLHKRTEEEMNDEIIKQLPGGKYQVMPPLSQSAQDGLEDSIRRLQRLLYPIFTDEDGNVLDGHWRLYFWHKLKREGVDLEPYQVIIVRGLSEAEKRAYARNLNLARRHLSQEERRELIAQQIKEDPKKSDRQIAAALGCDHKTVGSVREELEGRGEIPHVEEREDSLGRSQPTRKPMVFAKNRSEERRARKVLEAVPLASLPGHLIDARQATKAGRQYRLDHPPQVPAVQTIGEASIRHGDLLEALADVPDGSVDLILTDPPYDTPSIPRYADLSLLASRILKDDGVLVAYSGKIYLPDIVAALGQHLDYHWTLTLVQGGGASLVNSRFVCGRWKPLFVYVKKGCTRREKWLDDVIQGSGMEKSLHAWQQGEPEAAHLIEKLTDPGDLVVEPFLGSGTVAAAAVRLGRRFIGCDINPGAVAITQERLAALTREESA